MTILINISSRYAKIFSEVWRCCLKHLGGLLCLLEASRRPLGGLLGASREPLGGFLGHLEVDLTLNIILERLHFSKGPSWSRLGVDFCVF